jgi:hypothetical protein
MRAALFAGNSLRLIAKRISAPQRTPARRLRSIEPLTTSIASVADYFVRRAHLVHQSGSSSLEGEAALAAAILVAAFPLRLKGRAAPEALMGLMAGGAMDQFLSGGDALRPAMLCASEVKAALLGAILLLSPRKLTTAALAGMGLFSHADSSVSL